MSLIYQMPQVCADLVTTRVLLYRPPCSCKDGVVVIAYRNPMPYVHTQPDGSLLVRLQVQPRAAGNGLAGLHGDALRLRLTAPPVDGKANTAVIATLAKLLGLPKSALRLKSGHQSRTKSVVVTGIDAQHLRTLVQAALADGTRLDP